MELATIGLLAAGLIGLGSTVTYLLTRVLDESVMNLAAQHGRFVGLGAAERPSSSTGPRLRQTQHEVMHVIGIAR